MEPQTVTITIASALAVLVFALLLWFVVNPLLDFIGGFQDSFAGFNTEAISEGANLESLSAESLGALDIEEPESLDLSLDEVESYVLGR